MIAALMPALAMQGEDTMQTARRIAQTSTLSELPSLLQDDRVFPAYFSYSLSGASHAAEFAILLPVLPEEVMEWLEDVEHYPHWLLLASDGSPNLGKLSFNSITGMGRVAVIIM